MELQQYFQHALHIGITGMHLINNQHFIEQAQQSERLVSAVQNS